MTYSALVFVTALCITASSAIKVPGECPIVTLAQDFDVESYLGRWYQYAAFPSRFENGRCDYADYYDYVNGTFKTFDFSINLNTSLEWTVDGYAKLDSTAGEGQLSVSFPEYGTVNRAVYILGTDYTGYSVIFSCTFDGEYSHQHSWVITRERHPSTTILTEVQNIVDVNGLDSTLFKVTDQINCP